MEHNAGAFITEIYAALLANGNWQSFLDRLSGILPNGKVSLFYHDYAAQTGAFSLSSQFEQDKIVSYNQYYASVNPYVPKLIARQIGIGTRAEQMLPREKLFRTEFYCDFQRPQGLCSGVGVTLFRSDGCNFMLTLMSASADDSLSKSAASLLTTLAPHLGQAFNYYRRAGAAPSSYPIVGATADALDVALIAFGLGRRLRWANAAGRELLSRGDPIGIDARERLTASCPLVREALNTALGSALRGEGTSKRTMAVSSREAGLTRRLTILVPALAPFEQFFGEPCVLITVEEPKARDLPTELTLQLTFGLTPAEAKLALYMGNGAMLADAADALGVSQLTAKTQLKSIYAKIGVRRQAELVAKVHKLGSCSV